MRALALGSKQHHALVADNPDICLLGLDLSGTGMFDFGDVAGPAHRGYEQAMPLLETWLSRQGPTTPDRIDERTGRVAPDLA